MNDHLLHREAAAALRNSVQEAVFMSPIEFHPVPVRIAHPESLLALGIQAVLAGDTTFAVAVVPGSGGAEFPVAARGSVLITDYRLGLQWAQADQASARSPGAARARVLVMSARDREHEVRLALEQGVQGYLPATCTPAELVEAVRALSRGMRYLSPVVATRMANSFGRESLTLREQEVLALLARGECNKSIARRLEIAVGTVKAHVQAIMQKLGASSRTKAICIANERGLIEVQGFEAAAPWPAAAATTVPCAA